MALYLFDSILIIAFSERPDVENMSMSKIFEFSAFVLASVTRLYSPLASVADLNVFDEDVALLDRLRGANDPRFLDFLILANADVLAFVGTKNGFEGADEAAKYYKRNLRIYANLNRIPLTAEDRVFILSGGSHTAFLHEFMKRSPKYEVVNTMDYLK